MQQLAIGESSRPIEIVARNPWNRTNIELVVGGIYDFEGSGRFGSTQKTRVENRIASKVRTPEVVSRRGE